MASNILFDDYEVNSNHKIDGQYLIEKAQGYGLDKYITGRYSWLFVFNLILLEQRCGGDPHSVIREIKNLEGFGSSQTKPALEFRRAKLKGLWHKHFLSASPSFLARNITNHLSGGKLGELISQVFDANSCQVITKELIDDISRMVVVEALENRAANNKLTGEWIIFAKYQGQNYYLCLATHDSGDAIIAQTIKSACLGQFSFLRSFF